MNKREIYIETNKFDDTFSGSFIYNNTDNEFFKKVEIDLDELCAKYLLEEFDDRSPVGTYKQFPALNYLLTNIVEFKFKGGHPGTNKDARRENSRVLGQTICRYFVEKTFGNTFMANVGTLLGRKLPDEFSNITIKRKEDGDTPDFLFMDNQNKPCLAEAKGRRIAVPFGDEKFEGWRKQFERVEVEINGKATEVKGYITELAIANEDNKMVNSILYIEDPTLEGGQYRQGNLEKLIKFAHYERLLSNTFLNFVGNSLLSEDKLSKSKTYWVDIYRISGINSIEDEEIVSLSTFDEFRFPYPSNYKFVGITLRTLKSLLYIAKGERSESVTEVNYENFNSVFFRFPDGFVVCNANLLEYVERRRI
ncbi:MAG: hypothetical protein DI539_09890 [Flavobacterium psychrophilum]|nr:MAG: hypothetical protein DI539_09890 [Flavobacterium psychrophilum]